MSEFGERQATAILAPAVTSVLQPGEVILGVLKNLDAKGNPLVDYDCNPAGAPQLAVSTLPVTRRQVGRQVALLFAAGDLSRPVIVGFIHNPLEDLLENFGRPEEDAGVTELAGVVDPPAAAPGGTALASECVVVDGKKITIEAEQEVVLKCGDASITLTRAGKIIIRGKYVLSRASGVNRILGGSVQVN